MPKYHTIIELWDRMLNKEPIDRPNCEEILYGRQELALNANEFLNLIFST